MIKIQVRTTQSRALAVHARSLELFAQLNLVEKAISEGKFIDTMNAFFQGQCGIRARFYSHSCKINNHYLHVIHILLFLEQSITEQILETFLNEHNIKVERNS